MEEAFLVAEYLLERDDLRSEYERLCQDRGLSPDSELAAKKMSDHSLYAMAQLAMQAAREDMAIKCASAVLHDEAEKRDYAERIKEVFGEGLVTSRMAMSHEQMSTHVLTRAMRVTKRFPHDVVSDFGVVIPDYMESKLRGLSAKIYNLVQLAFLEATVTRHEDDGVHYVIHEFRDQSVGLNGADLIRFGIHNGAPYYEEDEREIEAVIEAFADGNHEVRIEAEGYLKALRREISSALERMLEK
nr:hypothetical protein BdHM001_35380 [Bdellovibrio sp. HM001]